MRKSKKKIVSGVLLLIALTFLGLALREQLSLRKSQTLSDKIKEEVSYMQDAPQTVRYMNAEGEILELLEVQIPNGWDKISSENPMKRRIDFDRLHEVNPDIARWLSIPGTIVEYPVMQEKTPGVYYYLWRDMEGNKNGWGSLLLPAIEDTTDMAHTIVFGHKTSRGDYAFATLPKYNSGTYYEDNPYVYLYYPNRVERWEIWMGGNVLGTDMVYRLPYTLGSERYEDLLGWIQSKAEVGTNIAPDKNTETLVLSTCNDRFGGDQEGRYILAAKPSLFYYYDEQLYTPGLKLEGVRAKQGAPVWRKENRDHF